MLGGVLAGGDGVALADGGGDEPVLGELQGGAAGDGDGVVAQPLPQRLVHQVGQVVGDRQQHGVGGRDGELAVEAAVGVAPAAALVGVGGVGARGHRREQRVDRGVRPVAARRRERDDLRLQDPAGLEDGGRPGVGGEVEAGGELLGVGDALERVVGEEGARAAARLDQAAELERAERLADRRAADAEVARELALGGQALAGVEDAAAQLLDEAVGDQLVALAHRQVVRTTFENWSCRQTSGSVAAMSASIKAIDPRSGEDVAEYPEATVADVDAAVAAAARAAVDPALADAGRRAALLRGAATRLRARGEEVVALAGVESGLPEVRLRGELGRTTGQLEAFAEVLATGAHLDAILDSADPSATPPRPDLRRTVVPLGPVAVFGASNFPLAFSTAGGDTASALAAGCPVVVKGHPAHPGTSTLVASEIAAAVEDAGLPAGTFGHVLAAAHEVGAALVDHPDVRAVAFTGSGRGGRALMDRAAARPVPIPVFAEMGSLNPVVVTAAALAARADAIVTALAGAIGTFGGQLCTKPGLVLVPEGEAGEAFAAALAATLGAREPEVLLAASIRDGLRSGLAALDAAPGVERLTAADADGLPGFRARPAVYRAHAADLGVIEAVGEEHFGPAAIVLTYASLDQATAALPRAGGQLTVTVHAEPGDHPNLVGLVATATRTAGRVLFDGVPTGVAVSWAQQHGGPYPAASDAGSGTSVGMTALRRFHRPVVYQDAPQSLLPPALRDGNPLGIWRRVDGELTRD